MANSSEHSREAHETVYQLLPQSSGSSQQSSVRSNSGSNDSNLMQIMNDSKYSKVVFSEVNETYPTDADIECRFYIGDAVVPTPNDTIGLFKIGWTNVSQCIVSKTLSQCESDNHFGERSMKFMASELPKYRDEFYQFCYLSTSIGICGASTPFRFYRPLEQDLVQMDNRNSDDEDFVVVRSQQALLQERLQQLVTANGVLEYSNRSLKQHNTSLSAQIKDLCSKKAEIEERINTMQAELSHYKEKCEHSRESSIEQTQHIEKLEQQSTCLTNEIIELRKLKGELEARIKYMQIDAQGFKDCMKSSEEKYYQQCCQIEHLEQQLAELKKIRIDQDIHLESTQLELIQITEKYNSLELNNSSQNELLIRRNDELKKLNNSAQLELIMQRNELNSLSKQATQQQIVIDGFKSNISLLEVELDQSRNTNANVMSERRDLDLENRLLRSELEDIKAKCDALEGNKDLMLNEINDLLKNKLTTSVELKLMNENMEEIRKKLEESENYQKLMSEEHQDKETEMQRQLEEMKHRLSQAADEYQKLYKQNTKLEGRMERIKSKVGFIRLQGQEIIGKTAPIAQNSAEQQSNPTEQSVISDSFVVPFVQTIQSKVLPTQPIKISSPPLKSEPECSPRSIDQIFDDMEAAAAVSSAISVKTSTKQSKLTDESSNTRQKQTDNYESINIITLPCNMCDEKIVCTERDLKPMTNHLEDKHAQHMCPFCSMLFDFNITGAENYFQMHVENHLDIVSNYEQPSAPNHFN